MATITPNQQHSQQPIAIVGQVLRSTLLRLRPLLAALLFTTIGSMLTELLPPLLLRRILDQYLKLDLAEGLWRIALIYVGALILASALGFAQTMVTTVIGQNALFDLRLLLARHLPRLPMRYFHTTPVGDTMSRLTTDVEAIETLFSAGLINAITDLMKIGGILVAMYTISPLLCGVTVLFAPVVLALAEFFRRHTLQAQLGVRRSVAEINTFLQETFSGARTLKAYGQEENAQDRFQQTLQNNLTHENDAAVYVAYLPCVMQVVRAMAVALVVWLGAQTGATQMAVVSVGGLAAFTDLVGRLFAPIEALSQEFQTIQQALAGLLRITELLQTPAEPRGETQQIAPTPRDQGATPAVVVEGLRFGYDPSCHVLQGMSLQVRAGRKIAIVGRTGAGKTTLLHLIAGLYRPESGNVAVFGYDPHCLDPASRRRLIGIVPQTLQIFEGDVHDNISLRDEAISHQAVERAARLVGLHETIMALPQGYRSNLGEGGVKLSYGQMQLLALARALAADPPLLLLDEPTSGLDALTERAVFDAFRAASQQRTIITISHRLSGVLDADEVHIVANGQIVQSGRPDELAGQRGWYSVFKQLEDLGWGVN